MKLITFENKVATKTSSADRKNCVTDDDINDIKEAINENANINIYSSDEIKIGKWGDKDLFRKKLEINYSDVTITNNNLEIDLSPLNVDFVMVDYTHSFYKKYISSGNNSYNSYSQLNNIATHKSSLSVMNNFSTQVSYYNDLPKKLLLKIGSSVTFDKLYLTLEYTKGE